MICQNYRSSVKQVFSLQNGMKFRNMKNEVSNNDMRQGPRMRLFGGYGMYY